MIGGNKQGIIQVCETITNEIFEDEKVWNDIQQLTGWLDFQGETTGYANYSTKIQESTHVFIADYMELDGKITAENSRMIVDGKRYDIMLIDNPMELNKQLEIYLKFTGGQ